MAQTSSAPTTSTVGVSLSSSRPYGSSSFALLDAIDAGIHDHEVMPFSHPWTDADPASRRRGSVQHWWSNRAGWKANDWHLELVVLFEDRPIGIQELFAKDFPVLREVVTGSWLSRPYQGRGFAKEMRTAVLHLAFEGLGALIARSNAFLDNPASGGVSKALGYRENGLYRAAPRGDAKVGVSFELSREEWCSQRLNFPHVDIAGLEQVLAMFSAPAC